MSQQPSNENSSKHIHEFVWKTNFGHDAELAWFVDGVVHLECMPCEEGAIQHGTTQIENNTYTRWIAPASESLAEKVRAEYRRKVREGTLVRATDIKSREKRRRVRKAKKQQQAKERTKRRRQVIAEHPVAIPTELRGVFILMRDGDVLDGRYRRVNRGERGDIRAINTNQPFTATGYHYGTTTYSRIGADRAVKSFKQLTHEELASFASLHIKKMGHYRNGYAEQQEQHERDSPRVS